VGSYVCVLANLGDCKAYHWSVRSKKVTDITRGNRQNIHDVRDPGGRLGPQLDKGMPDLRNLSTREIVCDDGDIIFMVTDGVHDNLDPQYLGKSPKSFGLDSPDGKWISVKDKDAEEAVIHNYSTEFLAGFVDRIHAKTSSNNNNNQHANNNNNSNNSDGHAAGAPPPTSLKRSSSGGDAGSKIAMSTNVAQLVDGLVDHVFEVTRASREFMQNFPGKVLPVDYVNYPGKMDHCTCVAFRVGEGAKIEDSSSAAASGDGDATASATSGTDSPQPRKKTF